MARHLKTGVYIFIFSLCNIILVGCSSDELPLFNQLNSLRVIAITTPTPEVSSGDNVTITPVISDVNSTTALTDTIQGCVDLGVSYGVTPTCEGNASKVVFRTNHTLVAPGVGENWTGLGDSFTFSVPNSVVMFTGRSLQEQFNGVNYLIEYILKNSSNQEVRSFRRIVVSTKATKNLNPVLTDIFLDGVTMTALPVGTKANLSSDLTSASAESYQIQDLNNVLASAVEVIGVTWMITDGKTKYFRSEAGQINEYTGPSATPVGRSAYVFAIARDQRGGVTVVKKKF